MGNNLERRGLLHSCCAREQKHDRNGQQDERRMIHIKVYRICRYDALFTETRVLAGIRVRLEARRIARGYGNADAVPAIENDARGPEVNLEFINLPRLHQLALLEAITIPRADDAVEHEHAPSVGINVAKLGCEIRVGTGRRCPEDNLDLPRNFHRLAENLAREDEHIGPIFDFPLVFRPHGKKEIGPPDSPTTSSHPFSP